MQKALLNRFGIVLLIASLALAVLAMSTLDFGSGPAISFFLVGLIAYAASAAVIYLQPPLIQQSLEDRNHEPLEEDFEADLDSGQDSDTPVLFASTQKALRYINTPASLSRSDLIGLLPRSLASHQTPLEKAQALREMLIAAIEKLRLPAEVTGTGAVAGSALGYHILREFYLEDKSVTYLCLRYNVAQANYYRQRKNAVLAISRDLEAHEALLS